MNCALCTDPDSNHTTVQHLAAQAESERVLCPECHEVEVKDEDERCGECLSEMAEMYHPDEGGSE